jgi:ABC-type glucose/galactose transport system permease subunit
VINLSLPDQLWFDLYRVSPYWQFIIKGGIIILAVALDSMKYAKKK